MSHNSKFHNNWQAAWEVAVTFNLFKLYRFYFNNIQGSHRALSFPEYSQHVMDFKKI